MSGDDNQSRLTWKHSQFISFICGYSKCSNVDEIKILYLVYQLFKVFKKKNISFDILYTNYLQLSWRTPDK